MHDEDHDLPDRAPPTRRGLVGWVRSWRPQTELAVVLPLAFGYPVAISTASVAFAWPAVTHTDDELLGVLAWEAVVLLAVGAVLGARGWRLRDLDLRPTWRQTAGGLGLYFATAVAWALLFSRSALPPALAVETGEAARTLPVILLVSVVNPFYEELLVVGYIVRGFERAGLRHALAVSVFIRALYHTYQGPIGALGSIVVGLVLGVAYLRWRKTWPLVVAHGLMDFVPLMMLKNG